MEITDFSAPGLPAYTLSTGSFIGSFNKVVMVTEFNLFLYNAVSDRESEDQYVGMISRKGIFEALQIMQRLGIKVVDKRRKLSNVSGVKETTK
jgi:hypothetical protein